MSGPQTFRITDRSSITAPPHTVKEWTDTTMVVFDFNSWLGPDQVLAGAFDVLFQTNPQTVAGAWVPFPGGCCSQDIPTTPPADVNPLTLRGMAILPDRRSVELSVGDGTPGLAYLASFIATAGPYARRKEVGVVLTCYAMRPLTTPTPLPPVTPIVVNGTFTLPIGSAGTVNINNTSNAPITITLPLNPVLDQSLLLKDTAGNAGTYPITIQPPGLNIDGNSNYVLLSNYMAIEVYWMGTQWGVR